MSESQRREQLIDTAIELFSKHGFHATGIDAILAASGVSKKTLYRHFRSKDELILAALRKYDGLFRNNFMRAVESRATAPKERLLAVFEVARDWFEDNSFYGCMFINAVGEYSDPDTPVRHQCKAFKSMIRDYLEQQCRGLVVADPAGLAEELAMVLEGATVTAQVSQNRTRAAEVAKTAAAALIDKALAGSAGA
ncbi:MAG: TetR/AcrR family transcriptional regulator [Rhodospirillales bacterium]